MGDCQAPLLRTDINTIQQPNGAFIIEIDQDAYVESLPDLKIPVTRLRAQGQMYPKEVAACRTALGGLQWLAIQTQPQPRSRCNILLTEIIVNGNLEHVREIQAMIGEVRKSLQKIRFVRPPDVQHWSDVSSSPWQTKHMQTVQRETAQEA